MHVNSIKATQEQFIKSEQAVIECEKHILNLLNHSEKIATFKLLEKIFG